MDNFNLNAGSFYTQNGHLGTNVAGYGLNIKEGSNARMGLATLSAGSVVVSTTAVTTNSRIQLTPQNGLTNAGFIAVTARTAGTSFTIGSSNASDARQIAWIIVEPSP
jgi:hypothetical protein